MPDRRDVEEEVEEQGEEEEVEKNTERGSVRVKTKEIEIKRFRMNSKTKMSNENDDIEETTETSNSQQEFSDEVETVDEASVYGSTFQSFRSEDDYDPYDLRTTSESLASTSPLTMIKYKPRPSNEKEEFDERCWDKSSQASSSRSSVSSFSIDQQQMNQSTGNRWLKNLLPGKGQKKSLAQEPTQKVVIEVPTGSTKKRAKLLQIVVGFDGVSSFAQENGQITVVGEGIDPVRMTACIRKKTCGNARLITVAAVEEKKLL